MLSFPNFLATKVKISVLVADFKDFTVFICQSFLKLLINYLIQMYTLRAQLPNLFLHYFVKY